MVNLQNFEMNDDSLLMFSNRYLFYHDTSLSGKNHLRCVKVRELVYDGNGKLGLAQPQA
jgi:uncharacterized protein YfaT (DUF1175 family)